MALKDEEFRRRYRESVDYKNQQLAAAQKNAKMMQKKSEELRKIGTMHEKESEKYEKLAQDYQGKAIEEKVAADIYHRDADKRDSLEADFILAPKDFMKAVSPVIKRYLKNYEELVNPEFVVTFEEEEIIVGAKRLKYEDTIVIFYKSKEGFVKRLYLTYIAWRIDRKRMQNRKYYLQNSYTFEPGETTKMLSLSEVKVNLLEEQISEL